MTIHGYPEELDYVNAVLHPSEPKCGSFLELFCKTCLAADSYNYELMRRPLSVLMAKYPAPPERMAMERHDRGAELPGDRELLDRTAG